MSRFDYVKYDEPSQVQQAQMKQAFEDMELLILGLGQNRSQSLALTKLEECYMWVGKTIRDSQNEREVNLTYGKP